MDPEVNAGLGATRSCLLPHVNTLYSIHDAIIQKIIISVSRAATSSYFTLTDISMAFLPLQANSREVP